MSFITRCFLHFWTNFCSFSQVEGAINRILTLFTTGNVLKFNQIFIFLLTQKHKIRDVPNLNPTTDQPKDEC